MAQDPPTSASDDQHVTLERRPVTDSARAAIVWLDRPALLNAMSWEMVLGLERALAEADADPAVCAVLVTGRGRAFSAGGDLDRYRVLQRDPVMLRFLDEHGPFRRVMVRINRVLMGGAFDPGARVLAAMLAALTAGTVIHPLVVDLDDATLRAQLLKQVRKLLPLR